jgi:hypothetical protein
VQATLASVYEDMILPGAGVLQEERVWLMAVGVVMGEISGKEVNVAVVIEISPSSANRMTAGETVPSCDGVVRSGDIDKGTGAVVAPQEVGLEALI